MEEIRERERERGVGGFFVQSKVYVKVKCY